MAKIHNYQIEKEKRSREKAGYQEKIREHKVKGLVRAALVLLILAILIVLVVVQYQKRIYTSYEVLSGTERETAGGSMDVRLGDSILTYSKDGAHCTDRDGEVLWNQTFEIQDVLLDICQDVAAIASYNGRDVYVVNEEKILGNFTVNLPIRNVAVSSSGRVVVVMADTEVTHYKIYSADGKELYEGEATMAGSGYPMAVSLSPNGELMQISYIYLDAGVQKTKVVFYNLGDVGANNADYMVSVHEYSDVVVPYVEFMNNQTAYAVGDNMMAIYSGSQKPTEQATFSFKEEIRSVFGNEEYVGLIFYAENAASLYMMNVYDATGKMVGTYHFNVEYSDVIFLEDAFLVYNDAECTLITFENVVKYNGSFEKSVRLMLPRKSSYKYVLVTPDSLDTVQLK